jgi:hypothetical protein
MAILFTTGTINQPDAGSVGLAMADRIRDDVVTHAAWELVEEFLPGGGAVEWTVLKCLAAQSGLPVDYFVVMARRLTDGVLYFWIGEGYNEATNTLTKFGHAGSTSTVLYDADGCTPNNKVLGTTAPGTTTGEPKYQFWTPAGTSTKWWITVSEDGFTVAFNGPANAFVHIGAFTPLTEMPFSMPVQMMGSNANDGSITRNPAAAGLNTYHGALIIDGGGGTSPGSFGPPLGFRSDMRYNDKLQNNQRPVAEQGIIITSLGGAQDAAIAVGWAVGKQKRMRIGGSPVPVGVAFGDAYELDGRLWVPYLPTDARMWDTGVASS